MARQKTQKTYIGSPCRKYGHVERYENSRSCVECHKMAAYNYAARNKEKILAKARAKDWSEERVNERIRRAEERMQTLLQKQKTLLDERIRRAEERLQTLLQKQKQLMEEKCIT